MQEKRRHFRKRVSLDVEFNVAEGARQPGLCRDFSLGGVHIDTTAPAPFGANVTVYLRLKGASTMSALPGIVRWVKPGSMGVQFGLLGARETYAITEMLADSLPPAG
ncbi:MAG TPA: PilZ domain-containing protein [Polyangiaceae bacterium]|nr:PilZ domain-containing protein [Polyangiaceae bacterium]